MATIRKDNNMQIETEDFRTLLVRIVESQVVLAEAVNRLSSETVHEDDIRNLLQGVDADHKIIIHTMHRLGETH
jgi:hypothetical protein